MFHFSLLLVFVQFCSHYYRQMLQVKHNLRKIKRSEVNMSHTPHIHSNIHRLKPMFFGLMHWSGRGGGLCNWHLYARMGTTTSIANWCCCHCCCWGLLSVFIWNGVTCSHSHSQLIIVQEIKLGKNYYELL